jgi:two-component system NarL family response regulator
VPDRPRISVLIVDDQPAVLLGLRMRLGLEPDLRIVGEATDGDSVLILAGSLAPKVIVLDLAMPATDGYAVLGAVPSVSPTSRVVVLSLYDHSQSRRRALALGAADVVGKAESSETLIAAIRRAAGSTPKDRRQAR